MSTAVAWNYTTLASSYDKRADYDAAHIGGVLQVAGLKPGDVVADIGAGTGKLTGLLLAHGLIVRAVEPNDGMRGYGIANTKTYGNAVTWSTGTGEVTGLAEASVKAAFFGSSFNVVDQARTLQEVARILMPQGIFCCLWNHRDLQDPLQLQIEAIIKKAIPEYDYGLRRSNPVAIIEESGLYETPVFVPARFIAAMTKDDIVTAWRSHATLQRQARDEAHFNEIIQAIAACVDSAAAGSTVPVPYETALWWARRKN